MTLLTDSLLDLFILLSLSPSLMTVSILLFMLFTAVTYVDDVVPSSSDGSTYDTDSTESSCENATESSSDNSSDSSSDNSSDEIVVTQTHQDSVSEGNQCSLEEEARHLMESTNAAMAAKLTQLAPEQRQSIDTIFKVMNMTFTQMLHDLEDEFRRQRNL